MRNAAFVTLLSEDQWLWEASSASEEAKKHNLKHVGGGAWANQQGQIVAKTNRKTKSLDWLNGSPEGGASSTADPSSDSQSPQITAPLTVDVDTANAAKNKLTNLMLALLGADEDPALQQHKSSISNAIVETIIGGKVDLPKDSGLTDEQLAELTDGLETYVLNPKNKLANQIKAYADAKMGKSAGESPTSIEPKKKTPFTPKKVGGTGEYDVDGALNALGLNKDSLSPENLTALEKLLQKAAEAKNQNTLNYIGAKLIKTGLIDKQNWKAFRKYHRTAFGVLPAGKGTDAPSEPTEPAPTDTPPEEPAAEEDPYEPQVPAIDHPDYKTVAHLFNAAGSNVPIHLATPEQMDAISSAVKNMYYANDNEELKNAIWSIPFLEKGDDEKILKYMQDSFPNSFPQEEPTPEEPAAEEPPVQHPTDHEDYPTVKFYMDKIGASDILNSVSFDDVTGIAADLEAAAKSTTLGERETIIGNLMDAGFLDATQANKLSQLFNKSFGAKSGDVQEPAVKADMEPEGTHPVWGVPMDMVSIVDQAVDVLGPWAENDVAFLNKADKQALANAIVNGYQSGSPNEVDNQFDELDSKTSLLGYQLADIANKVKELIQSPSAEPEAPAPEEPPVEEPAPSADFTPEEQQFVDEFNNLPDAVRLAAGKFVGDAMKSGIFMEPSKDTDFPFLLATVGKMFNDEQVKFIKHLKVLLDSKLVNPIYSPAQLATKLNTAKQELGIAPTTEPEAEPEPQVEPQPEPEVAPADEAVPQNVQVAVDGYEFSEPKLVKAVDTSMKAWAGGDAEKVMNWVLKKFNQSPSQTWQNAAMALVKNYGFNVNKVPLELMPPSIKQAIDNPETSVPASADVEPDIAPEPTSTEPTPTTPEPEPEAPMTAQDALGLATGYFSNYGVDLSKLDGAQKVKVVDSVQQALQADTDFGVMYAMQKLKKEGFLKPDLIDGLGIDILEKLESEGKINDDPEAFKTYLNGEEFVDNFLKANPSFAAGLTPEDKQKLVAAIRKGLPMKTYADSKAFYAQELHNKIPGFNDDIFQKWRNGAMQYHDEHKNLTKFISDKKEAIKKTKEEAEQLQKALQALGSGDSAAAISSIADVSGVSDPTQKKKIMVTIAQALQAPTSQLMIDKLNTLSGTNSYAGAGLDSTPSGMTPQAFKTLRSLVAATYFDQNGEDKKINYPEPKVNEPLNVRVGHVFDKWTEKYGMTLGHMPKNTSYYNAVGERQAVKDAVVQALQEPDQKKVNSILNSLVVTASSLTDKQINQLRQLVHNERKNPASLDPNYKPTVPQKYNATPKPTTTPTGTALPAKDVSNDPEYKKKSAYYKLPQDKKKEIHDAIFDVLGSNSIGTWNKAGMVNSLQYKLQNFGLDSATARKVALWAVRENQQNSPLAAKAKTANSAYNMAAQTSGATSKGTTLPPPGDEAAAKAFVASLDLKQDKYELASTEYVKGEKVVVKQQLEWTGAKNTNNNDYSQDLNNQKACRAKNRSAEDLQKFQDGMSSWLGSGQWSKPAQQRKALNEIMTRMVEGPPPQYAQVKTHVERGMSMSPEDFKDYIKAFKVGEPVYIGPSGFSANTGTAYGFGANPNNQSAEYVKVLMRVKPDKTGKIKMVRLDPFGSEQECVVGTNRQTRCTNVIKHVTYVGGQAMVAYEIELEYDETIQENKVLGESVGFNLNYWKGLSKETIKAMIKYNNSSVHTRWSE
jgi:hypothetical protein